MGRLWPLHLLGVSAAGAVPRKGHRLRAKPVPSADCSPGGFIGVAGTTQAPQLLQLLIWGHSQAFQQVYAAPQQGQMLSELPWVLSPPGATSHRQQGRKMRFCSPPAGFN